MADRLPAVSVCVPSYNGARYLSECLESILNQTFSAFELLIVDDGSSDDTMEIAREYRAADKRVRLVQNPRNLGLVGNWNRCVDLCRADWIKFVFQDDVLLPECIQYMMGATRTAYPLISCARDFIFDPATTEESKSFYRRNRDLAGSIFRDRGEMSARSFCEATLDNIGVNLIGEPTVVLLRADVFRDFGFFNAHLIAYCDAEYWSRVICRTGTFRIPDALARFRVHPAATSASNVESRAFRASLLDKLVIRHEMAFADHYAPLRDVALERTPPIDLVYSFWEHVHWTWWDARKSARDPSIADPAPLRELQALAAHYPRMAAIPARYRALRAWRGLQRRAAGWMHASGMTGRHEANISE